MARVTTPSSADAMAAAGAAAIDVFKRDTAPVARYVSTLRRPVYGRYKHGASMMQKAATLWPLLTDTERNDWNTTALTMRAASRVPVIDQRTGAPRHGKRFTATGFAIFAAQVHALNGEKPLSPNDPAREEPLTMTEFLTGATYEQRIIHHLNNTSEELTIAMYQVSPTWEPTSIAASPLMQTLLNQPARRPLCRLVLATPDGSGNLAMLNDLAALTMIDAGWSVRRANAYPVLHAKLWLMEPATVYVGSHNLSNRATTSNHEAGIITTSAAVASDVRAFLESRWNAAT